MEQSARALEVAKAFVDAVNRHRVDDLDGLMTEDHRFVDSLGATIQGRERVGVAWDGYFRMVPNYRIEIEEVHGIGSIALLLGTAHGTYAGEVWSTPGVWRVAARDGQVQEWRVYADNEPLRSLMRKARDEP